MLISLEARSFCNREVLYTLINVISNESKTFVFNKPSQNTFRMNEVDK